MFLYFILFMIPAALCAVNILALVKYNRDKSNDELFIVLYVFTTLISCISLAEIIFHVVSKSV